MSNRSEQLHNVDEDYLPHIKRTSGEPAVHVATLGSDGYANAREVSQLQDSFRQISPSLLDSNSRERRIDEVLLQRLGISDYDPNTEAGVIPQDVLKEMKIEGIA